MDSDSTLSRPIHTVQIAHRIGSLAMDVSFTITKPWTILFGPSGSGKTTILRAIAGLIRPNRGKIVSKVFPGTNLERTFTLVDTDMGKFTPAHERVIRMAPQQPSLFPNLTALENMKYGMSLFVRDRTEEEARDQLIEDLMNAFQIAHVANTRPGKLSGGEAQRVNLARARAAMGCRLLLLDEPFTGMDAELRTDLIVSLQNEQSFPETSQILSVTHDVAEAFQLGAEVIKIADGKVIAQGPVETVLAEERARLLQQLNP